jgi:EAL domain-containing protein (putative c-di-GMP-specific phosphodiesterase class I)/ActR/RegA family two-component response regulator
VISKTARPELLLIVDDEADMAAFIARVGRRCGFETETASSAEELFSRVRTAEPGHIILDLQMPDVDGIQVLRRLAELHCTSRILIASGVDQQIIDAAQRIGRERGLDIAGTLRKPMLVAELTAKLQELRSRAALIGRDRVAEAIAKRELLLYYQPKVALASSALVGFEALIRWNHPQLGLLPPERFVPLSEATDVIDSLTEWVAGEAARQLAALNEYDIDISINVSARNLAAVDFPDRLADIVAAAGADPARMIVELTETCAMADVVNAMDVLTRLRLKNFNLSMDDFGTGYSSMLQLLRMPICELKIDQSFVRDCDSERENRVVVKSIIDLGRNLGRTVTAEGVESAAVFGLLREWGCDIAQGFHVSRPLPPDGIPAWIDNWTAATGGSTRAEASRMGGTHGA